MRRTILFTLFLLLLIPILRYAFNYFGIIPLKSISTITKTITQKPSGYTVTQVVGGLSIPWSIVFTSPERMIVTERTGAIRVIQNGILQQNPLIAFREVSATDEEGLMGLALDPDYKRTKFIYASLAYSSGQSLKVKVVRLKDSGNSLTLDKIILDNIPAAAFHAGCRIKFGPDKKLYITTGDATTKELAQQLDSLAGKLLRINSDGSIPSDNPYPNSPVYSFGHRNSQGLDWHPITGVLFATEHGPTLFDGPAGGDEINIIVKGGNYGWPLVSHERNKEGLIAPELLFTPAVAPAAGLFYRSGTIPEFKNNFFFAALKGEGIYRVTVSEISPHKIISHEKLPDINFGRIREVMEGPDGAIYFSTSNRDGRGALREDDDKIYKISAK